MSECRLRRSRMTHEHVVVVTGHNGWLPTVTFQNPTSKPVACPSPQAFAKGRRINAASVRRAMLGGTWRGCQEHQMVVFFCGSRWRGQDTRDGSVQKYFL